jgi:hypothetical protein
MQIPPEVEARLVAGIQKFQPIVRRAKLSNRNESDTVTIIADILCEVFGYDKYEQITSELAIKRSFCDLAIRLDGQYRLLIECKAVGIDLRPEHVDQAVGYAANSGVEWVALTNGVCWRVYRVIFSRPVKNDLVLNFQFCDLNVNQPDDLLPLYALCVESFQGSGANEALEGLYSQGTALNRYIVAQLLLNGWMVDTIRRSLERHFPAVKISSEDVRALMHDEVFRPEVVTGPEAEKAAQEVAAADALMKATKKRK